MAEVTPVELMSRALSPALHDGAQAHIRLGRIDPGAETRFIVEMYRKDVVVKVKLRGFSKRSRPPAERGVIKGFSKESRKRLKFLIRNTSDMWEGFLTLTYPKDFPMSGPETKNHVHAFCTWLGRNKISYIWILEFQKRGAPHFHFLISGFMSKIKLKRKWADIVGSNDPKHIDQGAHIEAVKNPDEVGIYMAKYMGKLDQKEVPEGFKNVGRFWGASRCLTKVMYKFDCLYRDGARELRKFRKYNQVERSMIAEEQTKRANDFDKKSMTEKSAKTRAKFRIYSRTARRASFSYAKRWRWRGYGFVLIRGVSFFRSILRQAVRIDEGKDIWTEFSESDEKLKHYIPLCERGAQFMLDGSIDPDWLADSDELSNNNIA